MALCYKLVEIDEVGNLYAGTQIAVARSTESLHSSLKFFYPFLRNVKYYYHHGVYLGHCKVIHFSGQDKAHAKPRKCDIFQFWQGAVDGKLYKVEYNNPNVVYSTEKTLALANEVLANPEKWPGFQIINNNCESFATWLKTGKKISAQVNQAAVRIIPLAAGFYSATGSASIGKASVHSSGQ